MSSISSTFFVPANATVTINGAIPVVKAPVANATQSVEHIINNMISTGNQLATIPTRTLADSFTCSASERSQFTNGVVVYQQSTAGQSTFADKPYFDVVTDTISDVVAQSFEMIKNGVNSSVEVIQSATEKVSELAVENKEYIFGAAAFTGVSLMAKGAYDLYKNPFARVKAGTEMLSGFALATSAAVGFFFTME